MRAGLACAALLLLLLASCPPGGECNLVRLAEVPLELKSYVLVLPVSINGQAIEMLLDTGAHRL